jgi:hypothetical protein
VAELFPCQRPNGAADSEQVSGLFRSKRRARQDAPYLAAYANWPIPADLYDPAAFIMVGQMHNFGYLGGMLAIPLAWAFNFLLGRRAAKP